MADEEDDKKPVVPCNGLRYELLKCLRESDCVKKVNVNYFKGNSFKTFILHFCNPGLVDL